MKTKTTVTIEWEPNDAPSPEWAPLAEQVNVRVLARNLRLIADKVDEEIGGGTLPGDARFWIDDDMPPTKKDRTVMDALRWAQAMLEVLDGAGAVTAGARPSFRLGMAELARVIDKKHDGPVVIVKLYLLGWHTAGDTGVEVHRTAREQIAGLYQFLDDEGKAGVAALVKSGDMDRAWSLVEDLLDDEEREERVWWMVQEVALPLDKTVEVIL